MARSKLHFRRAFFILVATLNLTQAEVFFPKRLLVIAAKTFTAPALLAIILSFDLLLQNN